MICLFSAYAHCDCTVAFIIGYLVLFNQKKGDEKFLNSSFNQKREENLYNWIMNGMELHTAEIQLNFARKGFQQLFFC